MNQTVRLQNEIVSFLESRMSCCERLSPDADLLDAGLLDSLLIMDVVAHLEREYCVRLENDHIRPAHFRTPAAMARLVHLLQAACAEAI